MTSQDPLLPGRTIQLAPVRSAATATTVLLVASCAATAYGTWADWNRYRVAADFQSGEPGVGIADWVSAVNASYGAVWLRLIAVLATTAALLTWVWRARINAERLSPAEHRLSRAWAIGGWFCPVVQLWYPRVVLDDLWRASRPDERGSLVRYWWFAALAYVVLLVAIRLEALGEVTVTTLNTVAVCSTSSLLVLCLAAACLIHVVRQITRWQSAGR